MNCLVPYNDRFNPWIIDAADKGMDIRSLIGAEPLIVTVEGLPIGICNLIEAEGMLEPHVVWHPEATMRQKYVGFLNGMKELGARKNVLLMAIEDQKDFYEMWVERGVLRKVGVIEDIPEKNVINIHMYQLRRNVV